MSTKILLFISILLLPLATFAENCDEAQELIMQAVHASEAVKKETLYRQAISICPDSAEGRYNFSLFLKESGQIDEARAEVDKALAIKEDPLFFALRAQMKSEKGEQAGALDDFNKALALEPQNVAALQGLSALYVAQGDLERAEAALQKMTDKDTNTPTSLKARAVVLQKLGKLEEAVDTYKKVLELSPERSDVHRDLGFLYDRAGNLEKAEEHLRIAAQNNPKDIEAQYNLGVVLSKREKPDLAELALKQVTQLDPKNTKAFSALGWAQIKQEKYREAEESIQTALTLDPTNAKAHNSLGVIYWKKGKKKDAEREFKNAYRLDSSLTVAKDNLQKMESEKVEVK